MVCVGRGGGGEAGVCVWAFFQIKETEYKGKYKYKD